MRSRSLAGTWFAALLVASLLSLVTFGWVVDWLTLSPARIWRGEVWRVFTWILVEDTPYALLLGLLSIKRFAGDLATPWGDDRVFRFAMQVMIVAALVTSLLGLVSPGVMYMSRTGGLAVCGALTVMWARQFPNRVVRVHTAEVGGPLLIAVTFGLALLLALVKGVLVHAPELIACSLALVYPRPTR